MQTGLVKVSGLQAMRVITLMIASELTLVDEVVEIHIDEDRVVEISPSDRKPKGLLLPGFIDLHVHYPQLDIRGIRPQELLYWLNDLVFQHEAKLADEGYAKRLAKRFITELLANGTTTAAVFSSVHEGATDILFREAERAGLTLIAGKVMMDRNSPPELLEDTKASIEASLRLVNRWHGRGRLRYALTPRFAVSCSEELLREVARISRERGLMIQTHMSENRDEIKVVRETFGRDYVELLDELGLLSPRTIVAHAIHLSPEEMDVLKDRDVRVAHCPDSNLFLRSGIFKYHEMRERGIKFGLGSDVGAGTSLYMPYHAKIMAYSQVKPSGGGTYISPVEMFYRFTLASAEALNLEDVGGVWVGSRADLVLYMYEDLLEGSTEDVLSKLIFRSEDYKPSAVIVGGRVAYLRHEVTLDELVKVRAV